ncbi:MAG: DUF4126 domain-containing protein [Acidobacteriota bacterium]|nr:DUF4126 domain-containing protein [Acidobacteriota bacterium]
MTFDSSSIAALIVAASFAGGLNIYATILTLGLLARTHVVLLPPGLAMLSNPWLVGAAGTLFALEFFADKLPGFDLVWNALHTFVRVPVAALLAFQAANQMPAGMQLLATLAGALIAVAAHGSKTVLRAAVTPAPEPVSNIALSSSEDLLAIGLTWLATHHPFAAASIAGVLLLGILLAARALARVIGRPLRQFFSPFSSPSR